jgi:hypothetical protein
LGTTTTLFDVPLVDGGATADKPVVRLQQVIKPLESKMESNNFLISTFISHYSGNF